MSSEWYKNSSSQMHDPDMEELQRGDPASCAVWEWVKGECKRNDSDSLSCMSVEELSVASRRLGIDPERMKSILNKIVSVGWITGEKKVRSWGKWQSGSARRGVPPRTRWERKQDLEAIDSRVTELLAHRGVDAMGSPHWTNEAARVEYLELRRERKRIQQMMIQEARCS